MYHLLKATCQLSYLAGTRKQYQQLSIHENEREYLDTFTLQAKLIGRNDIQILEFQK